MRVLTVSFLINNYNYGRFLRQAIESALAQTYPQVEVVVVDDGSTDDSRDVIESYGARVVSVFKANGGQASAFNAGFAASQGDIISFLDADDYLSPQAAERLVAAWGDDVKILHHRLREVDEKGNPIGYYPALNRKLGAGNVIPELLDQGTYSAPTTTGLVYSRDLLLKILPMPETDYRLCADTYLFLSTPFLSPVTVLDETLAFYRFHNSNAYRDSSTRHRKRKKVEWSQFYLDLRWKLLLRLAEEHGYPRPDTKRWQHVPHLFERLLLLRSSSSKWGKSWDLANLLLKQVWERVFPSFLGRLKMTVLVATVLFAPRILLSFLYPNLFDRRKAVS